MREVNQQTISLIKMFEGLRLEPYKDSGGLWTIGIGHLIRPGEHFTRITTRQAEAILQSDLRVARGGVERVVKVPITDNQFGALVSFAFNCGTTALERSTLLKKLNAGNIKGAQDEFAKWNKVKGKVVRGLTRRRAAEAALFASTAITK